jgi:hypothetical protein
VGASVARSGSPLGKAAARRGPAGVAADSVPRPEAHELVADADRALHRLARHREHDVGVVAAGHRARPEEGAAVGGLGAPVKDRQRLAAEELQLEGHGAGSHRSGEELEPQVDGAPLGHVRRRARGPRDGLPGVEEERGGGALGLGSRSQEEEGKQDGGAHGSVGGTAGCAGGGE